MSEFWRSVVLVLSGTAIAQFVPVLGSLVLARLYAPSEFGVFSAWLGVVVLLSIIFTGRFEAALAIEVDGEPRRLAVASTLVTACLIAIVAAIVLAIGVLVFPSIAVGVPKVVIVIAIPTALAIAGAQTWQSWAAAEGAYRKLSSMRIVQAVAITLIQITAGVFYASANTLACAHLFGVIVGLAFSTYMMPVGTFPQGQAVATIKAFWHRQRRFPLLSLPADSINKAGAQLPILIVASRFGSEVAGLLALTMRVLGVPISLLGKSVLDVFKRHAAASFRERGECRDDYLRTFKVLAIASLVFCAVMPFVSEPLFAIAFGEQWRLSGVIALWMMPMFATGFIASPLSYMVYIAGKQNVDIIWQVALLGVVFVTLSIPHHYKFALQAYSVGYSLLYIVYLVMTYRFSLGEQK
ncbi:MAG: lipopolysaccharide biosynthesis protein [Alphaproteobacteria bacterium]|nr:lipopolysaccharide biosynthesis protein [Alphaproteobacteria bacterium]